MHFIDLLFREPFSFYNKVLFIDYIGDVVEFLYCDIFEGCVLVDDAYQLILKADVLTFEFGQNCDPPDITLKILSAIYFVFKGLIDEIIEPHIQLDLYR